MLLKILSSKLAGSRITSFAYSQFRSVSLKHISKAKPDFVIDRKFLYDKYDSYSYGQLLHLSKLLSNDILNLHETKDLNGQKVAIFCSNNYSYLISILAVWLSNGVPFCLNKLYPPNFIEYFLKDTNCKLIINSLESNSNNSEDLNDVLMKNDVKNYRLDEDKFYLKSVSSEAPERLRGFPNLVELLSKNEMSKQAFLLYTSGTSGPPKGVVITFENLLSSIDYMIESYQWSHNDFILNPLPLNHYSGLVYCLITPFFAGAQVDLMPKFHPQVVWDKILGENDINMFIGVPTIYTQLVESYITNKYRLKDTYGESFIKKKLKDKMRIIASGSAPLNIKTFNDWFNLTNYTIVERYGMTEIGMALTNPYKETDTFKRVGGCVGRPCGEVRVRLADPNSEADDKVLVESSAENDIFYIEDKEQKLFGELQIKGSNVFKEYFKNEEHTKKSFTKDGWFKTGDTAEFMRDLKIYKIIGRTTVDVIKSGGYKISALDIEKVILSHPEIDDVAVMGLSDPVWGQRVFSLLVLKQNIKQFNQDEFVRWCKSNLPKYSVPTIIKVIDKMPRNQLGKVNKKELIKKYEQEMQK